ncbi:MAG: type II toxin-antitoxin system HipA family toxin YjjJ [Candidatus Thiodiazotropha endolucinida]
MPFSIIDRLSQGPATSKELQAATGLSQPAISRQLRQMGDTIIKIPSGRSPRYAMTKNAFGAGNSLPLYTIDPFGNFVIVADIRPLAHGGFFVETRTGTPGVLLGENKIGLFDDLPYYLDDLRPQGFLGRQIAKRMSRISSDFPEDPRQWNTEHAGKYLISNGDDLPGNFIFGPTLYLKVRTPPVGVLKSDYPTLADNVLQGITPGSSAGGEQPKFTAFNKEKGHVIVKFSPLENNPIANRWRDILISEYHASEVLRKYELPAADMELHEVGDRLFLESKRFDRNGEYGRYPMISLQAVDAEFSGIGTDWPTVAHALHDNELLNLQHAFDISVLWYFGKLINNTDMHLGNISLSFEGNVFRLLPVYDMCSMGFAPSGSLVKPYAFTAPQPEDAKFLHEESIDNVRLIAMDFWESVSTDNRISEDLRNFLAKGNPVS